MDRRALEACLIAYVPVIHRGYVDLFRRIGADHELFVFDDTLIGEFDYLRKEIRALTPLAAMSGLSGIVGRNVSLAGPERLNAINAAQYLVAMPDEDVCKEVSRRYLRDCQISYDRTFLRWHRENIAVVHPVNYDRTVNVTDLDRDLMGRAQQAAQKSSDWWRQVGGVLLCGGNLSLTAHNRHVPTEYTPYIDGDPRNAFSKGINIELGTVRHAEIALICEAARRGISTQGAYLYTTTFPCPPCAKAVAGAGIVRCYYRDGYAMLDGERDLRDAGVEIIHVSVPVSA